jgi:hypothetical protein
MLTLRDVKTSAILLSSNLEKLYENGASSIRNDPVLVERLRAEAAASRRFDTTRRQSHS